MKSFSIKTTVAAVATATTLMTSSFAPTINAAHAESIFVPGLAGKIEPLTPGPCATKPWLCGPGGLTVEPVDPTPPPPPAPPAPGMNAGTAAAIGIVGGIIAGAAIASATQPKEVQVEPVGNANAHLSWCYAKYKSYRDWDNSWQPYHGPRKPCISPYL